MPRYNKLRIPIDSHRGEYEDITSINGIPVREFDRLMSWILNKDWRNAEEGNLVVLTSIGVQHEIPVKEIENVSISGAGVLVVTLRKQPDEEED